jgi:hypothetical protein
MGFPAGTSFSPYVFLRNSGHSSISVSPILFYTENGYGYARPLEHLTLSALESRQLPLLSELASMKLPEAISDVQIQFDVTERLGQLIIAAGSIDQSKTYVFEVLPKMLGTSLGTHLPSWSVGQGNDTMVSIWNHGNISQDVLATVFFGGAKYSYPVHLEPLAARMLSLGELISEQIPDAEGTTLPLSATSGSMAITSQAGETVPETVQVDAGIFNSYSATCAPVCTSCSGYVDYWINADPVAMGVGHAFNAHSTGQLDSGSQGDLTSSTVWTIAESSIATVSSNTISGVSAGTFGLHGEAFVHSGNASECMPPEYDENGDPITCPHNDDFTDDKNGDVVSVTLSLATSGSPDSDNEAGQFYTSYCNSSFGTFLRNTSSSNTCFTSDLNHSCNIGSQIKGTVTPSNYSGLIIVHQVRTSYATFSDSTSTGGDTTPFDDLAREAMRDDDPPPNGNVFAMDIPALAPISSTPARLRVNFRVYAQLVTGSQTVSSDLNYFVVASCKLDGSGNAVFVTDVTGDNRAATGSTPRTWNLQ